MHKYIGIVVVIIALVIGVMAGKHMGSSKEYSDSRGDQVSEKGEVKEKTQPYTQEIAPGVYSFSADGEYHSMFAVTDEGVAVFETVNSKHAAALLEAVKSVTDKPVLYAFQSHNHWDHAGGGKVFQDAGAQTVMHSLAAEWLAANPGMDTSPPDMVWDGSRKDITLGGLTIEMHYLGLNHGLGMTVFVIPEHEVAYIGDLVTPNRVMFSIVPDFNIGEWERSLTEILELNFEVAVCSHNALPADEVPFGCTKDHVAEEKQYIVDLRNAIIAEFQKGTADVVGAIELPQYSHWEHYDDWLEMNAYRVMLDLWMGPYPWVPESSGT
ncbi:MAG: glyoxylase-like metal-dependent hydrolase (beta-lactamase superfamily II) [Candidatus Azotimanducaceae bacterium]|jgi:glyoxylase-like metal-dependent hydrolase (beta-lactamase superfamily II)